MAGGGGGRRRGVTSRPMRSEEDDDEVASGYGTPRCRPFADVETPPPPPVVGLLLPPVGDPDPEAPTTEVIATPLEKVIATPLGVSLRARVVSPAAYAGVEEVDAGAERGGDGVEYPAGYGEARGQHRADTRDPLRPVPPCTGTDGGLEDGYEDAVPAAPSAEAVRRSSGGTLPQPALPASRQPAARREAPPAAEGGSTSTRRIGREGDVEAASAASTYEYVRGGSVTSSAHLPPQKAEAEVGTGWAIGTATPQDRARPSLAVHAAADAVLACAPVDAAAAAEQGRVVPGACHDVPVVAHPGPGSVLYHDLTEALGPLGCEGHGHRAGAGGGCAVYPAVDPDPLASFVAPPPPPPAPSLLHPASARPLAPPALGFAKHLDAPGWAARALEACRSPPPLLLADPPPPSCLVPAEDVHPTLVAVSRAAALAPEPPEWRRQHAKALSPPVAPKAAAPPAVGGAVSAGGGGGEAFTPLPLCLAAPLDSAALPRHAFPVEYESVLSATTAPAAPPTAVPSAPASSPSTAAQRDLLSPPLLGASAEEDASRAGGGALDDTAESFAEDAMPTESCPGAHSPAHADARGRGAPLEGCPHAPSDRDVMAVWEKEDGALAPAAPPPPLQPAATAEAATPAGNPEHRSAMDLVARARAAFTAQAAGGDAGGGAAAVSTEHASAMSLVARARALLEAAPPEPQQGGRHRSASASPLSAAGAASAEARGVAASPTASSPTIADVVEASPIAGRGASTQGTLSPGGSIEVTPLSASPRRDDEAAAPLRQALGWLAANAPLPHAATPYNSLCSSVRRPVSPAATQVSLRSDVDHAWQVAARRHLLAAEESNLRQAEAQLRRAQHELEVEREYYEEKGKLYASLHSLPTL
eukprot:TRINITY_DN2335_c1_g1_i1.p2 TRINITY_DN2335_c1_g1~~TRINITY_DN2335_c1_g1_i1.p2  ORF type:complete len:874 (+),score=191.06 TRINITY_DN2335_c1_g1_i1:94-2715(+)